VNCILEVESIDPFGYLFRFCCDPFFNGEREIESLKRFAQEARIDDVAVFCGVQELNTGHTGEKEQLAYLKLLFSVRESLPENVTVSVNQWHTLMHMDAGKSLAPGQDFRLMKDAESNEASLCVCPSCEKWRGYISRLHELYSKMQPFISWVEDDFRFHNHDPLEWGGCFCDWHMALYARKAGRVISRREFIEGVLQPGKPHEFRKIWLDCCREELEGAAGVIGAAVRRASPKSRVGLMSSLPQVHCAEGRDWKSLLGCLSGDAPPVARLHLPCYQETAPGKYMIAFNMAPMLNRAFLDPGTEVYPELENFPYSRFSKSLKFTRFQLFSSLPLNVSGMTIDLFDLNGNGIVFEEGYQDMLRDAKDSLNELNSIGCFKWESAGVSILAFQDSSRYIETSCGKSMDELYPHDAFFAGLLGAFGFPFKYDCDKMFLGAKGGVVAVSGQSLRNLEPCEIGSLFDCHFVILDGDAVETLISMGLGHLADARQCHWIRQNSGEIAYEQVEDNSICCGIPNARMSAMALSCDALKVEYSSREPITGFYNSRRERTADGMVATKNGRVLILPFGRIPSISELPPMLLTSVRKALFQRLLPGIPSISGQPFLFAYMRESGRRQALYAVNASLDDAQSIHINCAHPASASAFSSREGAWEKAAFTTTAEGADFSLPVPSLETALIIMEREDSK
jgi:hypothetical protein